MGAVGQLDAGGAALGVDRDTSHRGFGPDLGTGGAGRGGDGVGHAAHAALDPAPRPEVAVDLADPMMHEHVRRTRGHRPAPRPDDRLGGQGPFHSLVHEPLVQEVGGAHREQPNEVVDVAPGPATEPGAGAEPAWQFGQTHVRRHHVQQILHEAGNPLEVPVEVEVRLGVGLVELGDGVGVTSQVAPQREGAAIGEGDEVVRGDDRHLVPESLQLQVGDDAVRHERHDVGRARDPVAVPHLFGHRGAAEDVPALEHEDVEAGAGEVGGTGQPVVPAAHHYDVAGALGHESETSPPGRIPTGRAAGAGTSGPAPRGSPTPPQPGPVRPSRRWEGPCSGTHARSRRTRPQGSRGGPPRRGGSPRREPRAGRR